MSFRANFAKPNEPWHPAGRFGILAFCLIFLGFCLYRRMHLSPSYSGDPNLHMVIGLMLLLNHLAAAFRWSIPVTVAMRITSTTWLIFAIFYLFYWSPRLYPDL